MTTVIVRRIGRDGSWWVLGAATPNIVLTQPAALATIKSPVRLRGRSTAFEANVQVSIRQDDVTKPMVESALMGGANGRDGSVRRVVPIRGADEPLRRDRLVHRLVRDRKRIRGNRDRVRYSSW